MKRMKLSPYSILLIAFLFSCSSEEKSAIVINDYSHNVGDILFNPNSDNNSFLLCDSTKIISGRSTLTYSGGIKIVSDVLLENFADSYYYLGLVQKDQSNEIAAKKSFKESLDRFEGGNNGYSFNGFLDYNVNRSDVEAAISKGSMSFKKQRD